MHGKKEYDCVGCMGTSLWPSMMCGLFDPQKKQCKCYCLLGGLLCFSFISIHKALITGGKGRLCYEKQSQRLTFSKRYVVLTCRLLHCVVMNNTWKQMSKASVLSGNVTFFPLVSSLDYIKEKGKL